MTPIPKILTGLLEIEDPIMEKIRISILKSFDNTENMSLIMLRQCENREQTHCYSCNKEGICLFLNGVLHFKLGENETAIMELEAASQHFRSQGETWNDIIGRAMLGSTYEEGGKDHLALREYEKALETLTKDYIRLHPTEYIEKALILKNLLHDQLEGCSKQKKKAQPPKSVKNNTRLTMPWMPKYSGVYANPKGPTWSESFLKEDGVFIDEIIMDDKPHHIYSLKQGDHLITLIEGKKYGWAKVSGHSMNASKPVAIIENDFVLYYESNDASHGAIVVANCPDNSGSGYQFIVKRYSKSDHLLISETEPPGLYGPLPINRNVNIVGIVIAVAKFEGQPGNQGE